ncbi:hypothetical protein [Streptomyces adonidis]|uniref:hypothetical protein n=1 Tax=Streptomyces adonidis TaxID=3231367 RepID=UPI0034DB466A
MGPVQGRARAVLSVETVRRTGLCTAAELKERRRALKCISLGPSRIGGIARAALVRNSHWK